MSASTSLQLHPAESASAQREQEVAAGDFPRYSGKNVPDFSEQPDPQTASDLRRRVARRERHTLRTFLRSVTGYDRFKACGLRPQGSASVVVKLRADGCGSVSGLQSCSSIWACPTCAAAIRQQRADEVSRMATEHLKRGGRLLFVTATLHHLATDDLEVTLKAVADAWRALWQGDSFSTDFRAIYGLVGSVRAVEVTHGRHGWHPHLHVLLMVDPQPLAPQRTPKGRLKRRQLHGATGLLDAELAARVEDELWARWEKALGKSDRTAERKQGLKVQPVSNEKGITEYLLKVQDELGKTRSLGAELARGDLKTGKRKGKTPFELLRELSTLNAACSATCRGETAGSQVEKDRRRVRRLTALWREYERATKGHQAITYSAGLRKHFALEELSDDQVVNEEAGVSADAEVVLARQLSADEQFVVSKMDAYVELVEAIEVGGVAAVEDALAAIVQRWYGRFVITPGEDHPSWLVVMSDGSVAFVDGGSL